MTKRALPPALRRLRLILASAAILATAAAATWGYLGTFTDELVLRGDPATTLVSPDGTWEARLYVEAPGAEHTASVLVTVVTTGDGGQHQRVVYRGLDAALAWSAGNVLIVREYLSGGVRRVDPTGDLDDSADDRIGDARLLGVAIYVAFLPALTLLVVGLGLTFVLPRLLWQRQLRRASKSPIESELVD